MTSTATTTTDTATVWSRLAELENAIGEALAPDRPVLAERVAAGRVGPRQAQVVLEATRALDGLPHVDPGKIGWAERELCDLARILGPQDLAKVATKIRDVFDPDRSTPHVQGAFFVRGLG